MCFDFFCHFQGEIYNNFIFIIVLSIKEQTSMQETITKNKTFKVFKFVKKSHHKLCYKGFSKLQSSLWQKLKQT